MNTIFSNQTAPTFLTPTFPEVFKNPLKTLANVPNPIRLLSAYTQLSKFRKLDEAALEDMGLTQKDVMESKLSDFI